MLKKVFVLLLALGLASCSFSQSQYSGLETNKGYQEYLVKKQDLIVFEKERTVNELKDWK